MKILIINIVLSLFLLGCSPNKTGKTDYVRYIENSENGLRVAKKIGDREFILQYKSIDYLIVQDQMNEESEKDLKGYEYYTLEVIDSEGRNVLGITQSEGGSYDNAINYQTNGMIRNMNLVLGNDTLMCDEFHMERGTSITNKVRFIFSFPTAKESGEDRTEEDRYVIFHDRIFGTGTINMKIAATAINDIPELDYEKAL